ncbi:TonB family protein [Hymenobacter antarcticus]|uniref:Energy transducer TonB n=1 Tax=Hymenobacter antarcticus TaxID=486270 RepID=A0ABP7QFF0_9BACT
MMTNAQLATASLDDIVFDGRNRGYGAYALRGLYQRHIMRALVIATTICALLLLFPLISQLLKETMPPVAPPIVQANPIFIDMPTEPEAPVAPPEAVKPPTTPPQPSTIKNVVPVVVKEKDAPQESEVPNQIELLEKASSTTTTEGDPNAKAENPVIELKPGDGTGLLPDAATSKPYTYVEQMPELPGGGGQLAIVTAIQKAVKYPSLALRNEVEGKVFVSFTVNPKGDIIDVKIVKGLGSGLDEETMRAIKTLPRFIPGKQNGREVSVSFTVPVTYRIQ